MRNIFSAFRVPQFICHFFCAMAVALPLAGCGGGGGGGSSGGGGTDQFSSQNNVVSGTVAVGQPVANARVEVVSLYEAKQYYGLPVKEAMTDASGRYSIDMGNLRPPFLVAVYNGKDTTFDVLNSISAKAGIVNVTPLTDLLLSQLVPKSQDDSAFSLSDAYLLANVTEQQIADAQAKVVAYLRTRPDKYVAGNVTPVDVSMAGNFVTTPFEARAGDKYDDALEAFKTSLMEGENLLGVKEHMLNKNAPIANVDQLDTHYTIRCTGNICGRPDNNVMDGITGPFHAKYALVNALSVQMMYYSAGVRVDCGAAPEVPGLVPGQNILFPGNGRLNINSVLQNGLTLPLLSTRDMWMQVLPFGNGSGQKYISYYYGRTTLDYGNLPGMDWVMEFDTNGRIAGIGVSVPVNGVLRTATCTAI
jgi:hypothetical protein